MKPWLATLLILLACGGVSSAAEAPANPEPRAAPATPAKAAPAAQDARLRFCEDAWKLIRKQGKKEKPVLAKSAKPGEEPESLDPKLYLQALLDGYLARCPEPIGLHTKAAKQMQTQLAAGAEIRELRWLREMNPEALRTQTEWFSVRALGGSYGGGPEAIFFTLRHQDFIWEILRGGMAIGGVGFRNRRDSWFAYGGSAVGWQFQVGPTPLNELRFMAGCAGGIMSQIIGSGDNSYSGRLSLGPFFIFEFSWVRHFLQRFALQVGIETLVPVMEGGGFSTCNADCGLPEPPLMLFVGFRI